MPDRRGGGQIHRRFPRTARVNEVLREVLAEELERQADRDERLRLVTITGVDTEPDLRHAVVWIGSLPDDVADALAEHRVRLQGAIARQVRLKRTPQLAFRADPAVSSGQRVEEILRDVSRAAADEGVGEVGQSGDTEGGQ